MLPAFSYPRKSAQKYEIILIFATAHKINLGMKRLIIIVFCLLSVVLCLSAQPELNSSADSIVGVYEVNHNGELTKVRVYKNDHGTYTAQVFWVENRLDKKGNVRLDDKNPDKSRRNIECDKIIIIDGLVYDPDNDEYVMGYVLRQTVLEKMAEDNFDLPLKDIIRPILTFAEEDSVSDIWEKLLEKKEHISVIIDEYGSMRGIVTMEDVIETMLGQEIVDETDEVVDMQEYAKEQWEKAQKDMMKAE